MSVYKSRLKNLRTELKQAGLSALLVSKPIHIRYLTGFRGEDSWALVTTERTFILSDFRYAEELRSGFSWLELALRGKNERLRDVLKRIVSQEKIRQLGFEPSGLSYEIYQTLRSNLAKVKLVPTKRLIEKLRLIKDSAEIRLIREASRITDQAIGFAYRRASTRLKETDLKNLIEFKMRELGAEGPAFDTIVVSGALSSCPHAVSAKKHIKNGTMLLIDMGSKVSGYHSDLTRTFFAGSIPRRFDRIYQAVLDAQEAALAAIRPGEPISGVDGAARKVLDEAGYLKYFGHATGHGVGLEIHEAPTVSYINGEVLRENMVFTVEPGVYIPGWGGIRIEDTVRVTSNGFEFLTRYPKNKLKVNLGR